MKKVLILALTVLSCAAISQAAEFLRVDGSTDLTDGIYWTTNGLDFGVAPGGSDWVLFDSASFTDTNGIAYDNDNVYWGGMQFDDIAGPITFTSYTYAEQPWGIIATNVDTRINFYNWRCNQKDYLGIGPVLVGPECTLAFDGISGGKHAYVIYISGGGTMLVNGTASGGSTRMMFNISGAGTTIGGNGNWQPSVVNVTYPMFLDSGTFISPGDNGVGTLTITDSDDSHVGLYMADNTTLNYELGSGGGAFTGPSIDSDQLKLANMDAGDVVFAGTTVIDFLGTGSNGVYKLLDTDGGSNTWSGLTLSNQVFNWSGNAVTNLVITGGLVVTNLAGGLPSSALIMGDQGDYIGDIFLVVGELDLPYDPDSVFWNAGSGDWDINTSLNWSNDTDITVYYEKDGIGDAVTFDNTAPGVVTLNTAVNPLAVTFNASENYSLAGAGSINGSAALTKTGSGNLYLELANSYSGGTTIGGGAVALDTEGASLGSAPVIFTNSALLRMYRGNTTDNASYPVFGNELVVASGVTATVQSFPRGTWTGALTGSGTLNLRVNYVRGDITHNWSGFSGQLNVTGRTSYDEFRLATAMQLGSAKVDLADGVLMEQIINPPSGSGTETVQNIGELSGSAGAEVGGNPVNGRFVNWTVGALGTDSVFAGTISDLCTYNLYDGGGAARLTKVGAGTLTLSGTNIYTGATTVNGGTLNVSGSIASAAAVNGGTLNVSGAIVSNGVTVASGGTLNVSGSVASNVTVSAGGAVGGVGTIEGDLALGDDAQFVFNTNNYLTVSNSLTCGNFGADDVVCDDWSSVPIGSYFLVYGYTNSPLSGIDSTVYNMGGGRAAYVEDAFGILLLTVEEAVAVPDIGSAGISNNSMIIEWTGANYNIYTNSDLTVSNGWGVATNATSPATIPIGSESQLYYKLGN